ncbi:hypothetical protein Bca101_082922 [Brassica carinata]
MNPFCTKPRGLEFEGHGSSSARDASFLSSTSRYEHGELEFSFLALAKPASSQNQIETLRCPTSMPTTIFGFPTKAWKIMNVQKLEEEKMVIQASDLDLPLYLQILNDAISYFKEENKRSSEMDTQPLLKDFISGDGRGPRALKRAYWFESKRSI